MQIFLGLQSYNLTNINDDYILLTDIYDVHYLSNMEHGQHITMRDSKISKSISLHFCIFQKKDMVHCNIQIFRQNSCLEMKFEYYSD